VGGHLDLPEVFGDDLVLCPRTEERIDLLSCLLQRGINQGKRSDAEPAGDEESRLILPLDPVRTAERSQNIDPIPRNPRRENFCAGTDDVEDDAELVSLHMIDAEGTAQEGRSPLVHADIDKLTGEHLLCDLREKEGEYVDGWSDDAVGGDGAERLEHQLLSSSGSGASCSSSVLSSESSC